MRNVVSTNAHADPQKLTRTGKGMWITNHSSIQVRNSGFHDNGMEGIFAQRASSAAYEDVWAWRNQRDGLDIEQSVFVAITRGMYANNRCNGVETDIAYCLAVERGGKLQWRLPWRAEKRVQHRSDFDGAGAPQ